MKKTSSFEKFANKKKAGTVKEEYRKERREDKKERATAINQRFEEKRKDRQEKAATPEGHFPRTTGSEKKLPPKKRTNISATTQVRNSFIATRPKSRENYRDRDPNLKEDSSQMPLNKFIAYCGVCARRDAAALVKQGGVTVNGQSIIEPGFKVSTRDEIKLNGKRIFISKNLVYILLNKPKDFITTTEDPQGRKTVLDLIKNATTERIYPIGRLDRNTSGVLLFTNDGDLAQTLSHPKHEVKKIYEVRLDKPLLKTDFERILAGVTLEDGVIIPDAMGYVDSKDKSIIGIEIHSGKNRIVRRIFEHLKYDIRGLDRVMYAGLTKKNVNRGKWRFLTEKEVRLLKHFNKA